MSTPAELFDILKPHINNWKNVTQKKLMNQLEEAGNQKKLETGIQEVWKEATNRNGRLLLVEKSYVYTSDSGASKGVVYMPTKKYNRLTPVKDAVDEIIEKILNNGGDVEFVENGMLKNYHNIALIKFYQ
jgi:hypothetical protein